MRVCLDACVLYPTVLRQILLKCADKCLFQPVWSTRILEEWARAVAANFPDQAESVRAEIALVQDRFPQACISMTASDSFLFQLPDPNDVHVLEAAIEARASKLITFNLRDFPRLVCANFDVEVLHPDAFLRGLLNSGDGVVNAAVQEIFTLAKTMGAGEMSQRKFLKKAQLPRLAKALETLD